MPGSRSEAYALVVREIRVNLDYRRMCYDGGKEDWEQQPEKKPVALLDGDQLENLTTCFELDRGTS